MSAIRVTLTVWAGRRKKVCASALKAHIGAVEAAQKRTLAEWDAVYGLFLRTPVKG